MRSAPAKALVVLGGARSEAQLGMHRKGQLSVSVALWLAAALLSGLTLRVWVDPSRMAVDAWAADVVASLRSEPLSALMHALHEVQGKLVAVLILLWLGTLAWRRQWRAMGLLAAVVPGGMLVNSAFKWIIERPRPAALADVGSHGFAYPSGHVAAITVFCGYLVVVTFRLSTKLAWRVAASAAALCVVALVAFSRVYLGVHHVTDVKASVLLGVVWIGLCLWGARALAQDPHPTGR
jgi:undecaprenyl-diphosphatase